VTSVYFPIMKLLIATKILKNVAIKFCSICMLRINGLMLRVLFKFYSLF
jgi:hypothetical protein